MEWKEDSSCPTKRTIQLHELPDIPLERIFQYLDLMDKLHMDEVFSEHLYVQNLLWKMPELMVHAAEHMLFKLSHFHMRQLPFNDFLRIMEKTGGKLRRLTIPHHTHNNVVVIEKNCIHLIRSWNSDLFLSSALKNYNNLTRLELNFDSPMESQLVNFINVNKTLETLVLHVNNLTDTELENLSEKFDFFPKLHISVTAFRDRNITLTKFPELLLPERSHLEEMSARFMFPVEMQISRSFIRQLALSQSLTVLRLWFMHQDEIWTEGDFQMISQLENLMELGINGLSSGITDMSMIAIIEKCKNLEQLALTNVKPLSIESMSAIMTSSASLKAVKLENLGMEALLRDGETSKVEELSIDHCYIFAENGSRMIANFPNLKYLCLIDFGFYFFHTQSFRVNNGLLSVIRQNCLELQGLTINTGFETTMDGIALLVDMPKLRSCYFSGSRITSVYPEATVPSFVQSQSSGDIENIENCPVRDIITFRSEISNIRCLRIEDCLSFTASSLHRAFSHMMFLESLYISDCGASVTDEVIQTLVEFCPNLRTLHLIGCVKITSFGIHLLACHPSLVNLGLCELSIGPFPLCVFVRPSFKSLLLWGLKNFPKQLVLESITMEIKNSLYSLAYDDDILI